MESSNQPEVLDGGSSALEAGSREPMRSTLVKTNSAVSVGGYSVSSHVSIPVTGSIPLGALQVHQPPPAERPAPAPAAARLVADTRLARGAPRPEPECLKNGDCFFVLGLPENTNVGCDMMALNTQKTKFLGFRDLPPGPHFIWVSEPNAMSRCGHWFVAKDRGRVRVKQWDAYMEVLGDAGSQYEARSYRDNIESTYGKLVPYRYRPDDAHPPAPPPKDPPRPVSAAGPDLSTDDGVIWHHLTCHITEDLLRRITGRKDVSEWMVETSDMASGEVDLTQANRISKTVAGSELSFLFPRNDVDVHLLNITAGSGTQPDTTADILNVNNTGLTESDIIGELQFTFLTGAHLSNLSCIEQWWHLLLKVTLRAHSLVLARPSLCHSLIQTLHAQLVYNERYISSDGGGDDDDRVAGDQRQPRLGTGILEATSPRNMSRLREALKLYKRRLDEALLGLGDSITGEQGAVGHAFSDLEAWFWRYGWDLRSSSDEYDASEQQGKSRASEAHGARLEEDDDEDDDYEPVVVHLDEQGREVGLVNWG